MSYSSTEYIIHTFDKKIAQLDLYMFLDDRHIRSIIGGCIFGLLLNL